MRSHGNTSTKKIAELGLLVTIALILSYIESLIPFDFGIPGIKLGLPNLCIVIILYIWDVPEAILVNLLRIIISGFLFGNLSMIIYSIAGAVFSMLVMYLFKRYFNITISLASLLGGIFHNVGQCILAMIIIDNFPVGIYIPYLLIAGAITGFALGYIARLLKPRIVHLMEV